MSLGHYRQHAEAYAASTRHVDMAPLYARFLPHVPAGVRILDAGCGSGRDALAFLQRGYAVEAFDAIWACASLLHVPAHEQAQAWAGLWRALQPGSVIYASYKLGQGERVDEAGRAFTDADAQRLSEWLSPLPNVSRVDTWLSTDQRPGQAQTWLNALVHRQPAKR